MNLIVFGATGMVGRQLIQQALFNGHHVKAFGRNVFTENLPEDDRLELVQGALFDAGQVYNAVKGCDAVLSAIGGAYDGTDKTRSLGMKNIVLQMIKAGVKRIVAIGGIGVLNADEQLLVMEQEDFDTQYLPVSEEHKKAFEILKESGLEWTFICPPNINDGDPTGVFITSADYPPKPNNYHIQSGDLAMCMLNELNKSEFVQHRVGISN